MAGILPIKQPRHFGQQQINLGLSTLENQCLNFNLQGQRPEAREEAEAAGGGDEGLLGHVQRGHGARAGRRQGVHEPLASNTTYKVCYTLIGRFLRDR